MVKIFVDLDGVLADFDRHYLEVFGIVANKNIDNVDWKAVREKKDFYRHIPPMHDMQELWNGIKKYNPTILTGVPRSVEEAPRNKRDWIASHLGPEVQVITCPSSQKFLFCQPGDILIDDWEKYRHLWVGAGGFWITHISAKSSLEALENLMKGV